jgi:formylglycine-generating enzyme required for sulfatase activity
MCSKENNKFFLCFVGIALVFFIASCNNPTSSSNNLPDPEPEEKPKAIAMKPIQGGTFSMGNADIGTRTVTVDNFLLADAPVTLNNFRNFVEAVTYETEAQRGNGGAVLTGGNFQAISDAHWDNPYFTQTMNNPVTLVSWNDAVAFCNWLSGEEGLTPAYTVSGGTTTLDTSANGYRLPTEAEWEHAASAGSATGARFGTNTGTAPVGTNVGNSNALFDMHGNVWEWCADWFGAYGSSAENNPTGPANGTSRVLRGGSWFSGEDGVQSTFRNSYTPQSRYSHVGFRVARNAE